MKMNILKSKEIIIYSGIKFGTSGARGLVEQFSANAVLLLLMRLLL